ncbi:MAG: hypothetical protein L0Z62_49695 [Gemmataceae bacterium]|nr:hypothetical protein [Gemmataceae bacterium]
MTTPAHKHLWKSVLRQTGRDPTLVGYWLRRHRRTESLKPAELARHLRVGMEGLILLSLCQTPRADQFREDLEVICRRTGTDAAALALILRREQALAQWAEGGAPAAQGWLAAASDATPLEDTDEEPTDSSHEG